MKAAIVRAAGANPVFADFADPVPQAGEVRIAVSAAALSPVVRSRAAGTHYSASNQFPFVAGIDGVGRADGGRRVYFAMPKPPFGSMAEQVAVAAGRCVAIPDGLDDVTAAAIANPGMSSWAAYLARARLQPGETVLVNGATGAAGRLAIAIARHLGASRVIATARNTEALATVGADVGIALGDETLPQRLEEQFAAGIDVVIDFLWGRSAEAILMAGARAGIDAVPIRFVQVGSASGADITLPSAVLRAAAIELTGSGLGSIAPDLLFGALADLFAGAAAGKFAIATRSVPLSDVEIAWPQDEHGKRTVFTLGA